MDVATNIKWTIESIKKMINMPLFTLIKTSREILEKNFPRNEIQLSALFNAKSGACSENCAFCSQSIKWNTNAAKTKLCSADEVRKAAKKAKAAGASRLCFAAAWRGLQDRNVKQVVDIIKAIKEEGLTSCASLGLLSEDKAKALKDAGLDFYNHNIESSKNYYAKMVTTHTFEDRISTVNNASKAGLKVCCGGIIGMGESIDDRIEMLAELANMNPQPKSVPINILNPIKGTPVANKYKPIDSFDIIRVIATARMLMPKSYIRLSAGREFMGKELQAMCLFSGANSIFYGDKLLTTPNANPMNDIDLINQLDIKVEKIN
ncbi:Biotin synthase [Candidatus Xenohaliotis californiensis]|uniref:Biotin synthase n=1 Tax=Candidatus Xenohaliotis californiensis TaxID=84677 RepID=A0ABM9N927_9RICK|nr:Biotin synthase [Candidatus Xenohaliotis californiensis]